MNVSSFLSLERKKSASEYDIKIKSYYINSWGKDQENLNEGNRQCATSFVKSFHLHSMLGVNLT